MKRLKYFLKKYIFPYLAFLIIKIISKTIRITYINKEEIDRLLKEGKKIIFAFWHGRQFLLVDVHKDMNIVLMTSISKDGEMQTKIMELFGYSCVRGSSSQNAIAGLKALVREIRNGKNSALAVDGPRGPVYEVKEGIFFAALMGDALIVPVSSSARPSKIFTKAWDRYILPLPFSRGVISYGKYMEVKKGDDFKILSLELKKRLNELSKECDEYLK